MWIIIAIIVLILLYLSFKSNSKENYTELTNNINCDNEFFDEFTHSNSKNIEDDKTTTLIDNNNLSKTYIQTKINNSNTGELSENEIIFLKFMNNKSTDIEFSSRWEWQYDIKPRVTLSKLLNLKYLTYSKFKDNVKNSTISELKQFLKSQNYKISGNKEELINRVLSNFDEEILKRNFRKRKYILSDK